MLVECFLELAESFETLEETKSKYRNLKRRMKAFDKINKICKKYNFEITRYEGKLIINGIFKDIESEIK